MEDSEEKERGFKVQDRRRFSAEGEAKPETEESIKSEAEKSAPQNSAPQSELNPNRPGAKPGADTAAGASADTRYSAMGVPEPQLAGGPEPEITFATFLVGLSSEALALLGEMPDPVTGGRRRDLPAAQQLIDIIGVLHDKTRGNLDQNEQSLIEAILFDLRMKYVEIARQHTR